MIKEIWKGLIYNNVDYGYNYIISNYGRIKNIKTNKILNGSIGKEDSNNKYTRTTISIDGKSTSIKNHRAVACTFIDNPDNLPDVNHKDGNKNNNFVGNLEWVTQKENNIHAVINNFTESGEKHKWAKLKQEDVNYIRNNCIPYDEKNNIKYFANMFNVHTTTISKILNNKSWKEYDEFTYKIKDDNYTECYKLNNQELICECCGKPFISKNKKFCSNECYLKYKSSKIPKKEILEKLIKNMSFTKIGKMYNVSDNAIRKWCKKYELPYRKKDIDKIYY